jgi:hypothetical protein
MWPFTRKPKVFGEIFVSDHLTVVQRPPMHRTIIASGSRRVLNGSSEYHVLLPYTQAYVFHTPVSEYLKRLTRFRAFAFSMTAMPISSLEDRVHPLPVSHARPSSGYCMGSFAPREMQRKSVVRAAINHFWMSDFGSSGELSNMAYLTKMGYSYEKIFAECSLFGLSETFSTVAQCVTQFPPGARLLEWKDTSELEQV